MTRFLIFLLVTVMCLWLSGWHYGFVLASIDWISPDKQKKFKNQRFIYSMVFLIGGVAFGIFTTIEYITKGG